ncbi:tRNA glutamyl-Q(34) synthetase GluQRS [Ectothiorhodospiraceae bacterium BW-2]|nr:tRNA glutamyl-Q(34) synthetase GluQRS [Ectothiorhodospiraceae bacterium BW-2]
MPYCGRFAPSPTGPLHLGSLTTAVASYLQAHRCQGRWQLRLEDIDPPREAAGAAKRILITLEQFGFEWDALSYQSRHTERYQAALAELKAQGLLYYCDCSRQRVKAQAAAQQIPPHPYPGFCRERHLAAADPVAIRLRMPNQAVTFDDRHCGPQYQRPAETSGDLILRRRDGLFAYALAVVVDDGAEGVTEIVRGRDLLAQTGAHIVLQQALGLPQPDYCHLPLVTAQGEKLSKQNHAPALNPSRAAAELVQALTLLGQRPPPPLHSAPLQEVWQWAHHHWCPAQIPTSPALALVNR